MQIDIGISEDRRQQIAEGLSRLLADSYTLYLKTHNFHWNVDRADVHHLAYPVRAALYGNWRRQWMTSQNASGRWE